MNSPATVFVVDDDKAMRDLLKRLLESVGLGVELYESGERFLSAYDSEQPGCLILDVRLPGLSGLAVQAQLADQGSGLPVIFLTGYGDVSLAVRAMKAGALDVLEKPFPPQVLLDCIQQALKLDAQKRQERAQRQQIAARLVLLTLREREVLDLVVAGKANKVIGSQLDISEKTVEVHRSHVMEKMQAEGLADLVRMMLSLS